MKKVGIILLILISLIGCTPKSEKNSNNLEIVTSFYPMYIATLNITDGAENISVTNLTSTDVGCLHDYQLTTANMLMLNEADILIINGGGMESFVQKAIDNCENLKIINASEGILEIHNEEHETTHEEHEHNHGENAHIWVSVSLYIEQVENIRNELCKINPKNAEVYNKNAEEYINKLEKLKLEMHSELDNIINKDIVTFHEAFEFFAEEFDLNIVAVIEREPGTYPSAGELVDIIKIVEKTDAKAIFTEPQYFENAANIIANETGRKLYELDPIVSGEFTKEAYEEAMRENLKTLIKALK
ncbi:MAG: zinc ABC transporter substrate-binding protein [Clostridia bacterium]|nr:zinc ABC transporter substrate-binding protein [Clostridia bacterium]